MINPFGCLFLLSPVVTDAKTSHKPRDCCGCWEIHVAPAKP